MGSVEPIGKGKVQVGEDFELLGWDFVSNPSTHGAFMTPLKESKYLIEEKVSFFQSVWHHHLNVVRHTFKRFKVSNHLIQMVTF